ncbi:polyphosphate kinase 1 [Cytophaga sp. FL35]|uniref:polyphosphate kinase 1 n=1 Tax=Cytophaga sp. FL35 TaxID=1904456 RepID=UPI001653BC57|nr:polyphosphate kinase 1 [Cytophaga sp. FL35]MBC6998380.1 polyphosphate kinase 1 [Cytophaga sp. FL35]
MEERLYQHRDLSWLSFNGRVLQEAQDKRNPLYERIKFLAIFSSNLDEFFRVRVSKLRQIKNVDKQIRKKLKLRPTKTLKEIINRVETQQEIFGSIFKEGIIPELQRNGIHLISKDEFTKDQQQEAKAFFNSNVKEHIEIVPVSEGEIPFLANNALYFYIRFTDSSSSFVSIPSDKVPRFVTLPATDQKHFITFLDDIISLESHNLFKNKKIQSLFEVKLSRDAELYWEDNFDGDIAHQIGESLSQRKVGQPTRLLYDFSMPETDRKALRHILGLGKVDMFPGGKYHNYSDFMSFPDPSNNPELHFKPLPPLPHPVLSHSPDIFASIRQADQMLHFPYHSFDPVLEFLEKATIDPQTESIKISLYRIAKDSKLALALLKALENGKKVMVFVEPKARFDEANNLEWSKKLKEHGAEVYHSDLEIKVHSKIMMVERKEEETLQRYAYISTGNFNRKTSKIYADHGLFTADPRISGELAQVFEVLERKRLAPITKHLMVSPFSTRTKFYQLIDQEVKNAKEGLPAGIKIKMNSLQDKDMIAKIYEAAEAGVSVRLLVRGFCALHMGNEKAAKNIQVTSIVDRFLEHGRIYWFENNGAPKMFTGSADWMTRNLDRRIEVLTPIYDREIFKELSHILELQLSDNVKARIIDEVESNEYFANDEKQCRSQYEIYKVLKEKVIVSAD